MIWLYILLGLIALAVIAGMWIIARGSAIREQQQPTGQPTQPMPLGDLVVSPHQEHIAQQRTEAIDPDPALGCRWCGPPFSPSAICRCASPCGDRQCGALEWDATANTQELT